MKLFDLTDKTAVITGSTKGIGKAIAERMAEHGANIVVSSRGDDDIGAVLRHAFGYGLADAFGRASDDGGFVSKIEKFHVEKSYVNVSGCYVGQCAVGVTYLAWKYLWIEPRSRPRRG